MSTATTKKSRGQFYTTNSSYILEGLPGPPSDCLRVVEPFAGKGDLIDWVKSQGYTGPIEAYDIEPKRTDIQQRDTLKQPPSYTDAWIITNPPYLARNKSSSKDIYDLYATNDLYKCFLTSLTQQQPPCRGGILIIPAGFFFSPRDIDVRCRGNFLTKYRILKVRYFEETVFDDTTTTIVAIAFERSASPLQSQQVPWELLPTKLQKTFPMEAKYDWIIGGDIYNLPVPETVKIRRHVEGNPLKQGEQQTYLTLNALDSGGADGRISLDYKHGYIYPAQDCSRTYATLRISGKQLSEQEQQTLSKKFGEFVEAKRSETWSLFLPQYRESKEYARKRMPFELGYRIVLHLIQTEFGTNRNTP
jgi:hypothetical protein